MEWDMVKQTVRMGHASLDRAQAIVLVENGTTEAHGFRTEQDAKRYAAAVADDWRDRLSLRVRRDLVGAVAYAADGTRRASLTVTCS